MVGEEVGVARRPAGAMLLPPSLVTQVEDEDVEREEDQDTGDGVGSDAENANFGVEAFVQEIKDVDGGRSRMKRGIRGGRKVDRHNYLQGAGME